MLFEAILLVKRWRKEYNHISPYSSLGYSPPVTEAGMHIDGNISQLLFVGTERNRTTTETQNSALGLSLEVDQTMGAGHLAYLLSMENRIRSL
jgi:hypothetical protein